MADIIQIRRDTAANWTSANPTLAQGEMGYEIDTDKMKIGDGTTAWTSLLYFLAGGLELTDLSAAVAAAGTANLSYNNTNGVFTYTPPDLSSYATATSATAFTNKTGAISQWTNDSGYITSYTETDTLDTVTGRGNTTTNAITVGGFTSTGIDDNATSVAVTIDASENVGIGRTSGLRKLTVEDTTDTYIAVRSPDANKAGVLFGDATSDTPAWIRYNNSNNSMDFRVNAAERMRIDGSGNVGIGETNPDDLLHMTSSDAGTVLKIENTNATGGARIELMNSGGGYNQYIYFGDQLDNNAGVIRYSHTSNYMSFTVNAIPHAMFIKSNGNVGIGTTSPDFPLDVSGNVIFGSTAGGSEGGEIRLRNKAGTDYAGILDIDSSDNLRILPAANKNLELGIQIAGTGQTAFFANASEAMRIDANGNVGIGTTTPTGSQLHVKGAAGNTAGDITGNVRVQNPTGGSGSTGYTFSVDPTYAKQGIFATRQYANGGGSMIFAVDTATDAADVAVTDEKMRIDAEGDVGIGSTSPDSKLHIKGANTASGNFNNADATGAALILEDTVVAAGSGGQILFSSPFAGAGVSGSFAGIKGYITNGSGPAGDLVFQTRTASGDILERMRINSSGNVIVGKTTADGNGTSSTTGITLNAAGMLAVTSASNNIAASFNRKGTDGPVIYIRNDGTLVGSIAVAGAATAYNTSSDYRLKDITGGLQDSGAYIDSLNPVEGTWKEDGSTFVGLIAHEAQEASRTPIATGEKDGEEMQGMDYSSAEIIANLIKEVQLLRTRVASLEA